MSIKELREVTGLSQAMFAIKFHIPKSTISHWEQGVRQPPEYVIWMITEILRYEKLLK